MPDTNKHGTCHGLNKAALKTLQRYRSDAYAAGNTALAYAIAVAIAEMISPDSDRLVDQVLGYYADVRAGRKAEAA